jgi:peptidyl-tRNA hydrolase
MGTMSREEFRKLIVEQPELALSRLKESAADPDQFIEYWCYALSSKRGDLDVDSAPVFKTWKEDGDLKTILMSIDHKKLYSRFHQEAEKKETT